MRPLFAVSALWVGKMSGAALTPLTLYDTMREEISDRQSIWEEEQEEREAGFCRLSQPSENVWPETVENYLLIGSGYGGGDEDFGIRPAGLDKDDPLV